MVLKDVNSPHKFIPTITPKFQKPDLPRNIQQITSQLDEQYFEENDEKRRGARAC